LTAGDFEQGIVGDGSKMINQLAERAHRVPWDIFVLAIDEVEALVKSREGDKNSASMLSVILGLITGVKDVPNLIVFCATNHIEMIDNAFLRRMNIKIFVGKPSYEGRKEWIRRNKENGVVFIDEATENAVVAMTVNFSHDAMKQFLKSLKYNLVYEGNNNSKIDLEYSKKFILGLCSSERIIFGKYFLPNLITSKHLVDIAKIDLTKVLVAFTGRVMIDLDSYLQMEVLPLKEKTTGELGEGLTNFINKDKLMNYKDLVKLLSLGVELKSYNIQDFAQRMYNGLTQTSSLNINKC
jgi:hypothetical protein